MWPDKAVAHKEIDRDEHKTEYNAMQCSSVSTNSAKPYPCRAGSFWTRRDIFAWILFHTIGYATPRLVDLWQNTDTNAHGRWSQLASAGVRRIPPWSDFEVGTRRSWTKSSAIKFISSSLRIDSWNSYTAAKTVDLHLLKGLNEWTTTICCQLDSGTTTVLQTAMANDSMLDAKNRRRKRQSIKGGSKAIGITSKMFSHNTRRRAGRWQSAPRSEKPDAD